MVINEAKGVVKQTENGNTKISEKGSGSERGVM